MSILFLTLTIFESIDFHSKLEVQLFFLSDSYKRMFDGGKKNEKKEERVKERERQEKKGPRSNINGNSEQYP